MQPKAGYKDENPKTRLYRKAEREKERERERDKPHGEAKPHNLLNIDLFGLASSYLHPCPFARAYEVTPLLQACTCNDKGNKLVDKQRNN